MKGLSLSGTRGRYNPQKHTRLKEKWDDDGGRRHSTAAMVHHTRRLHLCTDWWAAPKDLPAVLILQIHYMAIHFRPDAIILCAPIALTNHYWPIQRFSIILSSSSTAFDTVWQSILIGDSNLLFSVYIWDPVLSGKSTSKECVELRLSGTSDEGMPQKCGCCESITHGAA